MFYNINGERRKLVICGTGTFAQLAFRYFTVDSDYDVYAFVDIEDKCSPHVVDIEDKSLPPLSHVGDSIPTLPFSSFQESYDAQEYELFVALDTAESSMRRKDIYQHAKNEGYRLASYVSSKAAVMGGLRHGDNVFIMENAVIQPGAVIGSNVVVGCGCVLEAGCTVPDHTRLSSLTLVTPDGITSIAGGVCGSQ